MAAGKERERWLVKPGKSFTLAGIDPGSTAGSPTKAEVVEAFAGFHDRLYGLQERLWAERRQSLLIVVQGIDAGGKDGTMKHLFLGLNPAGSRVASFRAPTEDELAHDFLWRVHRHTPARGEIVLFNRSHYEDVLVVRVHDLVPEAVWRPRYRLIREFEDNLTAAGTAVVKVFLHISKEEQAQRFRARVEDPTKRWKFRAADVSERAYWDQYQEAFAEALSETSTKTSPWYVIPANHKWYRNWAVSQIVIETLSEMDPQYPPAEATPFWGQKLVP